MLAALRPVVAAIVCTTGRRRALPVPRARHRGRAGIGPIGHVEPTPRWALERARRRVPRVVSRRLDLLDRSGAWYSSLSRPPRSPGFRMTHVSPCSLDRLFAIAAPPCLSSRRRSTGAARSSREASEHPASPSRMGRQHKWRTGTVDQPAQIDCDDMQFFADYGGDLQEAGLLIAAGTSSSSPAATASGRPDGVQHQDPDRHVLQRVRHGGPRRGHPAQPVRRPGARRVLLGREAREAGPEEIQITRADSRPACSRRPDGRSRRARRR